LEGTNTQFDLPFPSWSDMLLRCLVYFIIEDAFFYLVHRWLHTDWAYKNIHRQHHTFDAPIAMASSYAHPFEMVLLGIGSFIGPFLVGLYGSGHMFAWWVWMTVRQIEALDVHSGFDFPWHLSKFIPFYCGPHHHDYHHMTYNGNYASTFIWMDWLFGTDKAYRGREIKPKNKKDL
jgi:sterol desaturase/sphingolipid hydroxylase (fatty acid hydroxylase superfamily)